MFLVSSLREGFIKKKKFGNFPYHQKAPSPLYNKGKNILFYLIYGV